MYPNDFRDGIDKYASTLVWEAINLANISTIRNFSYAEINSYLNERYQFLYRRISLIEYGYYSKYKLVTADRMTLPPNVYQLLAVFEAHKQPGQELPTPLSSNWEFYTKASNREVRNQRTFAQSGPFVYINSYNDPSRRMPIWIQYVENPPLINFTYNNYLPDVVSAAEPLPVKNDYGQWTIEYSGNSFLLRSKLDANNYLDLTRAVLALPKEEPGYSLVRYITDYPYMFATYYNQNVDKYLSCIWEALQNNPHYFVYNPFDFMGKPSNVEYIQASFNEFTGMGVTILDHYDGKYKHLGYTPDTLISYPNLTCYNYLMSQLAYKFMMKNHTQEPAVSELMVESKYELEKYLKPNRAAWQKIRLVNPIYNFDYI